MRRRSTSMTPLRRRSPSVSVTVSRVDPKLLFVGSQHLWRSSDEGQSWTRLGAELTRADPRTLGDSGGPIFAGGGKTIVAIVAWTSGAKGHKCGEITQGPLMAPLRDWIGSVMKRWAP